MLCYKMENVPTCPISADPVTYIKCLKSEPFSIMIGDQHFCSVTAKRLYYMAPDPCNLGSDYSTMDSLSVVNTMVLQMLLFRL